jgi:hypothetical protein
MIAAYHKTTTRTVIGSLTERHLLAMVTPTTVLAGIGRVDLDSYSASFFRFADQHIEESRPRRVTYTFSETVVMHHPVDLQIFNRYETVGVYDLSAGLVGEVGTLETYPLVDSGNYLASFLTFRCTLFSLRKLSLSASQFLFFFAKEAGIGYLRTIRQGSKAVQADIKADLVRVLWKNIRLYVITAKASVPFASARAGDSASFGIAFNRSMEFNLDMTDLRDYQFVTDKLTAARDLREGDRVIPSIALEAGITSFFVTGLNSPKESLKSQIEPDGYVLQYLTMHQTKPITYKLQSWQLIDLLVQPRRFAWLLVSVTTFSQPMVIEPATFFKLHLEQGFLLPSWV